MNVPPQRVGGVTKLAVRERRWRPPEGGTLWRSRRSPGGGSTRPPKLFEPRPTLASQAEHSHELSDIILISTADIAKPCWERAKRWSSSFEGFKLTCLREDNARYFRI
jgi:hypothetical protein